MKKKITAVLLAFVMVLTGTVCAASSVEEEVIEANTELDTSSLGANAKSAILMELETGRVLFEKNADEALEPASITKIMTMALVLEQIQEGKLSYDDMVTASAHAKEMGGTQINLDEGEQMKVYDLMMSVAVASANDSCVALAEHIGNGNEAIFVEMMNQKAKDLGMENAVFKNTNGLPEDGHVLSARDIALMSRYLLSFEDAREFISTDRYPVRSGEDEYMMRNSNALIREYDGAIGTKTGYTQNAGHCLSAAATRGDMTLIAVVLGEPESKMRFEEAAALLDYGFSKYVLFDMGIEVQVPDPIPVKKGLRQDVTATLPEEKLPKQVIELGADPKVEKDFKMKKSLTAPVKKGDELGSFTVTMDGELVYEYVYTAAETVNRRTFIESMKIMWKKLLVI